MSLNEWPRNAVWADDGAIEFEPSDNDGDDDSEKSESAPRIRIRRRSAAARQRAAAALQQARATRWLVWSTFDGDRTLVGSYADPHSARRIARTLTKATSVRHFSRIAA
jgi:hypothetical protein